MTLEKISSLPEEQTEHKTEGKFEKFASEIGKVVDLKNKAYGNSFAEAGEFLKILYPNGIPVEAYNDALTLTRIFDKLKRIATNNDPFGEDPFFDIAGYAILGAYNNKKLKEERKQRLQAAAEQLQKQADVDAAKKRIDQHLKAAENGIKASLEKRGVELGTPPSYEEEIEEILKKQPLFEISQLKHIMKKRHPEFWNEPYVEKAVERLFIEKKITKMSAGDVLRWNGSNTESNGGDSDEDDYRGADHD